MDDIIYIVKIERLVESFEHDKIEKDTYASSWDRTTNIVVFPTKKEAEEFLTELKKTYHAKGKIKSGCIHGKKRIFENNGKNFRTWDDETIHTELFETIFGKEMEITDESDVGEYGGC